MGVASKRGGTAEISPAPRALLCAVNGIVLFAAVFREEIMNLRAIVGLVSASFVLVTAACSGSSNNSDGSSNGGSSNGGASSSGGTPVPTADCKSRCEKKAAECGAPAKDAEQGCSNTCNGGLTNTQLTCLEGKSCQELESKSVDALCPGGGTSSGGQSSSGTSGQSSSGSGGNKFSCSLNGTCYKCQDSEGVQKCSLQTGPGPGCTKTDSSYCER